jgi:sodium transport system ATP-binding protein
MAATENSTEPFLLAEGLRKEYGDVVALKELNLAVHPGEVVGLLGPNGAGKTTALRMLAAILTPTAGRASVCGNDTRRKPLEAKKNLGFLSGDTALYKRLTPRELLFYFGRLHDMKDADIATRSDELIEQLGMGDFADRYCSTLSSGQQQKANIARTLLHDPPVLILDEPTTALDIVTGKFIMDAIQQAKADRRAILFSTHIMSEAEYLCDRIALIHQGEIRGQGTLDELREETGKANLTEIFLDFIGEDSTDGAD